MDDRENFRTKYSASLAPDPYESKVPLLSPPQRRTEFVAEERFSNMRLHDRLRMSDDWIPEDDDVQSRIADVLDDFFEFVPDPADPEDVATLQARTLTEACEYRCCICLEPQVAGDVHLDFACDHVMHESCSRKWFEYGKTCPVCRGTPWSKDLQ